MDENKDINIEAQKLAIYATLQNLSEKLNGALSSSVKDMEQSRNENIRKVGHHLKNSLSEIDKAVEYLKKELGNL